MPYSIITHYKGFFPVKFSVVLLQSWFGGTVPHFFPWGKLFRGLLADCSPLSDFCQGRHLWRSSSKCLLYPFTEWDLLKVGFAPFSPAYLQMQCWAAFPALMLSSHPDWVAQVLPHASFAPSLNSTSLSWQGIGMKWETDWRSGGMLIGRGTGCDRYCCAWQLCGWFLITKQHLTSQLPSSCS